MSGYGKVISGGAKMSKGLSKGINNKLEGFADENKRRATVAGAVRQAFTVRHLSDQTTNNVSAGGKFQTVKERAKVQPS
jgi:hypothetical protein